MNHNKRHWRSKCSLEVGIIDLCRLLTSKFRIVWVLYMESFTPNDLLVHHQFVIKACAIQDLRGFVPFYEDGCSKEDTSIEKIPKAFKVEGIFRNGDDLWIINRNFMKKLPANSPQTDIWLQSGFRIVSQIYLIRI